MTLSRQSRETSRSVQPQSPYCSRLHSKSGALSVLNHISPPGLSASQHSFWKLGAVRRRLNCRFFGQGSGKFM